VFDVNYREPSVERLSFHLEDEQSVVFPDDASIEDIVDKPYAKYTKFLDGCKQEISSCTKSYLL
jgi:hypothetical protein